jgi:(1->4)-alpha-D-glucan 1-alpha-D-glucosylmutase
LLDTCEDGRVKLYVTQRLLCLRREHPELFVGAGYTPLRGNPNVAAFARSADGHVLLIVTPVQIATLMGGNTSPPIGREVWRDDRLLIPGEPGRVYSDLFTGAKLTPRESDGRAVLDMADVLGVFPVAALLSD